MTHEEMVHIQIQIHTQLVFYYLQSSSIKAKNYEFNANLKRINIFNFGNLCLPKPNLLIVFYDD